METEEYEDFQTYLPGYTSSKDYFQDVFRALFGATQAARAFPDAVSRLRHYKNYHGAHQVVRNQARSIISVMNALTESQGVKKAVEPTQEDPDVIEQLTEITDIIYDNLHYVLDDATGAKAQETELPEELLVASVQTAAINTSWNQVKTSKGQTVRLLTAKNISRPQLKFSEKIDNTHSPFVPLIKEKPNSIKPLAILPEVVDGREEFGHPYEWEIEKFEPTEDMLQTVEPMVPKPIEQTRLIFIETEEQLKAMCKDLMKQKEIAIDLEHHSYRSFQGLTCLMQISSRRKDYIVDTLKLRSELQELNEIFTHPKIVKVLHGADMDILWLQRDFGVYMVNMFDTGQAARVLNFAHFSLAFLLKHYCKVEANKAFQLADWRIRPLPAEMIRYAQEDTHYLLYIYDCMKNELLEKGNQVKNLLRAVFQRSKVVCLKKYEKPEFHDDSYLELLRKSKKLFNPRQLYALKELFAWRDSFARMEDESIGYVLPNHMLLQIAEVLPRELQGILACCNPIPPLVRSQANEMHSIILKARDSRMFQILKDEKPLRRSEINVELDLENILHCPHDTHHQHEETLHLPTLFDENQVISNSEDEHIAVKSEPSLLLVNKEKFKTKKPTPEQSRKYEESLETLKSYSSPFQRYQLVKKFNVAYKLGGNEDESATDADRIRRIHEHFKRLAAVADNDDVIEMTPQQNTIANTPGSNRTQSATPEVNQKTQDGTVNEGQSVMRNGSNRDLEVAPIRRKEKKKKNKRKQENVDNPTNTIAEYILSPDETAEEPSPKKSKALDNTSKIKENPEKSISNSKSHSSDRDEKGRFPTKKVFNPDADEEDYQVASESRTKKKKHLKQATFSHVNKRSGGDKMSWPKR